MTPTRTFLVTAVLLGPGIGIPIARADEAPRPPSLADLTADLASPDVQKRVDAALELAKRGPAAKEAAPALRATLKDDVVLVRTLAAVALVNIDPAHADEQLALLEPFFTGKHVPRDQQGQAFTALVLLRVDSPQVVAWLLGLVRSDRPRAQLAGQLVLDRVGPAAREAAPALKAALKDPVSRVRVAAAAHLVDIDPGCTAEAAAVLKSALKDETFAVRLAAGTALARVRPGERIAVADALAPDLDNPDQDARLGAAQLLIELDPKEQAKTMRTLADALKSAEPGIRRDAARRLGAAGPAAAAAEDDLRGALKDADAATAVAAAESLLCIFPDRAGAFFLELVKQRDRLDGSQRASIWEVKLRLEDIVDSGAEGADKEAFFRETVGPLELQLAKSAKDAGDELDQLDAAIRLGRLGPKAARAASTLWTILQTERSPLLCSQAAFALGQMGSEARIAAPDLVRIAQDAKQRPLGLRLVVRQALTKIDPEAAKKLDPP